MSAAGSPRGARRRAPEGDVCARWLASVGAYLDGVAPVVRRVEGRLQDAPGCQCRPASASARERASGERQAARREPPRLREKTGRAPTCAGATAAHASAATEAASTAPTPRATRATMTSAPSEAGATGSDKLLTRFGQAAVANSLLRKSQRLPGSRSPLPLTPPRPIPPFTPAQRGGGASPGADSRGGGRGGPASGLWKTKISRGRLGPSS